MFNLEPVGKYFIQLCGTTPCRLRGAGDIVKVCQDRIGDQHHVTADGLFSWLEVECLGACCNAPMAQINVDYYEDLTPANFRQLLDDLRNGRATKPGPQNGRTGSEPEGGPQTLTDKALYDGSMIGAGDWQKRIAEQRKAAAEAAAAKAAAEAEAKKAAEAEAKKAEATPAAVAEKPATETAAAARPQPSSPAQPSSAANDTPAAKGKVENKDVAEAAKPAAADNKPAAAPAPAAAAESKPELLTAARGGKGDDLELIWGVGPKLGKMLNEMGVWHYDQIAKWTPAELAWVDARLTGFKGRALRDDWIAQSKKLATGWRPESKLGDKPAE
jgi:NADH-quinone oxidoreductase subunit E